MLTMRQIRKAYGTSVAIESADLEVGPGEVMALLGENGAGKSTLVKILAGLEQPDAGSIEIDGREWKLRSAGQARAAGVGYVAQELSIIEQLSVAENVFLGDDSFGWRRSPARMARAASPYLARMGLGEIDPLTSAGSLTVGERQLVEIARLLSRKSRVAILDEPTAALSEIEIERVERAVKELAAQRCAVVYVTHRLREVFRLSQRVTILRNGKSYPSASTSDLTVEQLIERMLGRRLDQMFPRKATTLGPDVASVASGVTVGLRRPASIAVRRGEILALAGQVGSGATTILRLLAGLTPLAGGSMTLAGKPYRPGSLREAISAGVCYCSDDRKRNGIFANRRAIETLSSPSLGRVSRLGVIDSGAERKFALGIAERFGIDQRYLSRSTGQLSGGNQQKVALGKWIGVAPRLLLVEEPTRGVDVGARAQIYDHLRALADDGVGIVFASSDTQEVIGLADRIATFYHGRLVRVVAAGDATVELITRDVTMPDLNEPEPAVHG